MTEDHWVYKAYNDEDELLYVGYTGVGRARIIAHNSAAWGPDVARFEIEHLPLRGLALERERELIKSDRPLANVIHRAPEPLPLREPRSDGLYWAEEVAEFVNFSMATIGRVIKDGELEAEVEDGTWVVTPEALTRWLEAGEPEPAK